VRSLLDLDQRCAAARRARALVATLERELGGDPSAAQRELITRVALLSVLSGDAEVAILNGVPIDVTAYCTLANTQRRILSTLGIERRAKVINTGHDDHDSAAVAELLALLRPDGDGAAAVAEEAQEAQEARGP